MHILIAPNAFKNSLSAAAAAEAIGRGLRQSRLRCTVEIFPVGDGGDGTGNLLLERLNGERIMVNVSDPLGLPVSAPLGWVEEEHIAIIEMADASGLRLLGRDELDPLRASSQGTGEMIRMALDRGATQILLCLGGSATCDGGAGILHALGVRFSNLEGEWIPPYPGALAALAGVDTAPLDARLKNTKLTLLCDVGNGLLGPRGSATIFAPQKGASPAQVIRLEEILTRFRDYTERATGVDMNALPFGGAAGGVAAGLHAYLSAGLVRGIDYFLDVAGFDAALKKSDFVITGEGSLDDQTLEGKAPQGVAERAAKRGVPVIALAGRIPDKPSAELLRHFPVLLPICPAPTDLETALRQTSANLTRTAESVGNFLCLENSSSFLAWKKGRDR